jgi:hypothetical protein
MIGISGILWGERDRYPDTGTPTFSPPSLSDTKADDPKGDTKADVDRRAADFLSRGIARSMRSNSEGFGE